jgi:hypothetical protein
MNKNTTLIVPKLKSSIPKDRMILIHIYAGWVVAHYTPVTDQYIYAHFKTELYAGEWIDHYFKNSYINEDQIKDWRDI